VKGQWAPIATCLLLLGVRPGLGTGSSASASSPARPAQEATAREVKTTAARPGPPRERSARAPAYRLIFLGPAEPKYTGEPISLDLKDADIRDVLLTFSKLTGLNIVVDPGVQGSVTVRLHDVPWDQALEVILRSNGLGYVLEDNVARVGPPEKL
jgi:type II secretory pathway component GspD/PulD (secretin)